MVTLSNPSPLEEFAQRSKKCSSSTRCPTYAWGLLHSKDPRRCSSSHNSLRVIHSNHPVHLHILLRSSSAHSRLVWFLQLQKRLILSSILGCLDWVSEHGEEQHDCDRAAVYGKIPCIISGIDNIWKSEIKFSIEILCPPPPSSS